MLLDANTKPLNAKKKIVEELLKGASDSRHPFRYVTMATLDPDKGESGIRMLVLREVRGQDNIILYTDSRTEKVDHLQACNRASLLFWHDRHKVQVTAKCDVVIHHQDEMSEKYWKGDVHGAAQKAYTPTVSPGTSIDNPGQAHEWPDEYSDEYFCVLECKPYEMQILQLAGKEHYRIQLDREDEHDDWKASWIAP